VDGGGHHQRGVLDEVPAPDHGLRSLWEVYGRLVRRLPGDAVLFRRVHASGMANPSSQLYGWVPIFPGRDRNSDLDFRPVPPYATTGDGKEMWFRAP
jgi:hypothetical protein